MAKNAYIGIDGVARKIKKAYVGAYSDPQAGHPECIVSTADYLLYSYGSRNYKKLNAGEAYCASVIYRTTNYYLAPLIVSKTKEAVHYYIDGDYDYTCTTATPFLFRGETWYVSGTSALFAVNKNPNGTVIHLNSVLGVVAYDSMVSAAQAFLAYAVPQASVYKADYLLFTYSGRNFKKLNAEEAYCASAIYGGYLRPMIVGKTKESAYYYTDGNYSLTERGVTTVSFKGETWYVCGGGAAYKTTTNPKGNVIHLNAITGVSDYATREEAALALLEYATKFPSGENVARLIRKAYIGVNGVARLFYNLPKYVLELVSTGVGNATTATTYMIEEDGYIYAYVGRTASAYGSAGNRSRVNFSLTGLKEGDEVSITYSSQLGGDTGFYCHQYDNDQNCQIDEIYNQTNYTRNITCPTNSGLVFRVDNGKTGTTEAWVKIHKITVNGEQVYPY